MLGLTSGTPPIEHALGRLAAFIQQRIRHVYR
jgi:hypothetical protein